MDDWETLLDELDTFVTEKECAEERLKEPKDIREARKRFGKYLLKRLVKNLQKYLAENNTIPTKTFCKRLKLSPDEFKQHASEFRHFNICFEKGQTYAEAKMQLKLRDLKSIRDDTLAELNKMKQPKTVRKKTLNDFWQRKVPGLAKRGKANTKEIQVLGRIFMADKIWIEDFNACSTWADNIRAEFEGRLGSNQYSDVFDKAVAWTERKMERDGKVFLDDFKRQYTLLNGGPSKKWTSLNKRIRDRLSLQTKFTKSTRVGKRSKKCIVQNWYWVKK